MQHPSCALSVGKHGETLGPKGLFRRHFNDLRILRERTINAVELGARGRRQSDAKALRPLIHFRAAVRCHQGGAAKLHGHVHDHIIAAWHAAFRIGRIAIAKDAAYFAAEDIGIAGHRLETVAFEEQVDHRFHMRFLPERFGLPYALNAGWQWMTKRLPEKEDDFAAVSQLPARREAKTNSFRAQ